MSWNYDPTKISHMYLPEESPIYTIQRERGALLVSLVTRSCLHVCEIINQDNTLYSLPLDLWKVEWGLSFNQILADIVFYQLITWDYDRDLCLWSDYRSKHGENITTHNCRIWSHGTYSIFDIEWDFIRLKKEDIEWQIIKYIKKLLSFNHYNSPITFQTIWPDYGLLDNNELVDRILKHTRELLYIYDSPEGKIFFLRQCWKAFSPWMSARNISEREDIWYDEDREQYDNLIYSLRNIYHHLSENYEELFYSREFTRSNLKGEIWIHFRQLIKWVKSYILSFLP